MDTQDQVAWFVTGAVEEYGDRILAAEHPDTGGPQAVGCVLARLIFGRAEAGGIPEPLAALVQQPGSERAWSAFDSHIEDVLESDTGLAAAVAEVLAGYYQRQLASGDGQALAEVGERLWRDDPDLAKLAFERAVEAGNAHALLGLARFRWMVFRDFDGAVALYEQGAASPEAGIAAEALVGLGEVHRDRSGLELRAARDAWERCIASGNAEWAPHAMSSLGHLLDREGDTDGAVEMLQAAFDSGHPEVAPRAMLWAGILLERDGDDDGAEAAYQRWAGASPPGGKGERVVQAR